MALRNLSLGKTFIICLVGRSFAAECLCETRDFVIVEDTIHAVAATACSFDVSLGVY